MPFSFQISRVARRVCMRAEGRVDLHSSLAAGYRLVGDGRMGHDFAVLVDMRGSSWNPSCDEAMDLATAAAQIPCPKGRVALLVGPEGVAAARIFCDLAAAHGIEAEVFERTADAQRWLSIGRRLH